MKDKTLGILLVFLFVGIASVASYAVAEILYEYEEVSELNESSEIIENSTFQEYIITEEDEKLIEELVIQEVGIEEINIVELTEEDLFIEDVMIVSDIGSRGLIR